MNDVAAITAFAQLHVEDAAAASAAEQALRGRFWFFFASLFIDLTTPANKSRFASWVMDEARAGARAYVEGKSGNVYTAYLRRVYGPYL